MSVSTTVTLDDITQSVAIDPMFMGYLVDYRVVEPFLRQYDLQGKGSKTVQVPNLSSNAGTVNDGGGGVDTEFNATQGTDLSSTTTQSTASRTIASVEYAVYMAVTDDIAEDSMPGMADAIMDEIFANAAELLLLAYEDDVWALFSALNGGTVVGTTQQALTLANVNSAIASIRNASVRYPDGLVACLAPVQVSDLEDAVVATSSTQAVYDATSDRYNAIQRADGQAVSHGHVLTYRGMPIMQSGLADFANTNEDRVGAVFVPSTPGNNRYAALGKTISRPLRIEPQRDATLRGVELVASARWGSGELQDKAGVPLVTDA